MFNRRGSANVWMGVLVCACWVSPAPVYADHAKFPVDHGFLSVAYEDMEVVRRDNGFDLIHIAPGAFTAVGNYDAVMIDQPEIWVDKNSDYPGTKPDYLKAIVDLVRDKLTGALIRGGHDVVETPGPKVVFIRVALTDLYLQKKPGKASVGYTSIETMSAAQMLDSMLESFDIVDMALQLEVVDLDTEALLGAVVVRRGERTGMSTSSDQRLDFAEFMAVVDTYARRLRCRFDNGRLPEEQWADCPALD